jgi:hypothetical protein
MEARAWRGGNDKTYGIRVGVSNRDRFFDRSWTEIEVEIDSKTHRFNLTPGFWRDCPEFRDRGTPILREWLRTHRTLDWEKGHPPSVSLIPAGANRFRLLP